MTRYSDVIPGSKRNYGWTATFDRTEGYLGITQAQGDPTLTLPNGPGRVLLSPKQVNELLKFLRAERKSRR